MPKIILTAEEEIQYIRELDRIQEMMPDLEIRIESQPNVYQTPYAMKDSSVGDEFRNFLKANNLKMSLADISNK